MTFLAIGIMGAFGALLILLGFGVSRALSRITLLELRPPTMVTQAYDDGWIRETLLAQSVVLKDQTLAIEEGIERVARAEQRVKEAVRRAKARADAAGYEDPGVEAEVAELDRRDDGGSEQSELSLLHAGVEDDGGHPSSIRGVTIEQLQRARGWQ